MYEFSPYKYKLVKCLTKKILFCLCIILNYIYISYSHADTGVINGGGGKGVLCGSHLELLDVYEAKKNGILMRYMEPKLFVFLMLLSTYQEVTI